MGNDITKLDEEKIKEDFANKRYPLHIKSIEKEKTQNNGMGRIYNVYVKEKDEAIIVAVNDVGVIIAPT